MQFYPQISNITAFAKFTKFSLNASYVLVSATEGKSIAFNYGAIHLINQRNKIFSNLDIFI